MTDIHPFLGILPPILIVSDTAIVVLIILAIAGIFMAYAVWIRPPARILPPREEPITPEEVLQQIQDIPLDIKDYAQPLSLVVREYLESSHRIERGTHMTTSEILATDPRESVRAFVAGCEQEVYGHVRLMEHERMQLKSLAEKIILDDSTVSSHTQSY